MTTFLVGAAFAALLALAIATVVTGVVTALRIGPPPPPITCRGCRAPHTPKDNAPGTPR
ncbi:hypothetical protein ACFZCK_03855 [Kitasatospora purpeofusca]|uniref:hypothetical protein n=1 Tax=Kitasatospora purpeofusca TaxID=67352 RepID=UPI0036E53664